MESDELTLQQLDVSSCRPKELPIGVQTETRRHGCMVERNGDRFKQREANADRITPSVSSDIKCPSMEV